MSGIDINSSTESGVTDPPYWMRTASAVAWSYMDASFALKNLWTFCAVSEGHTSPVNSACMSPDGKHVVTASADCTARVWLLADGSLVRTLKGHTDSVRSACVSPDGMHVVTASGDYTARAWLLVE